MNKKIIAIISIVILIAAVFTVILVNSKYSPSSKGTHTYESIEEANKAADFNLEHSDRLCGCPATGFDANSSTIEVEFGSAGYIRKTLGVSDNSGNKSSFDESSEQEVNGSTVTLKGKDGKVYLAVWNSNNFAYTISLDEKGSGVPAEEMIEYIEATR